jgi:hypothetical protein
VKLWLEIGHVNKPLIMKLREMEQHIFYIIEGATENASAFKMAQMSI